MIPAFSAAGVLPPFVGDAATPKPRSPYAVSISDVVQRFSTSAKRCEILRGWLSYRAGLHALGFLDGFQWVDGSFCEQLATREPNDVDLVTFYVKPTGVDLAALVASQPELFSPRLAKPRYLCDVYFVELHGGGHADPALVTYWYSLFSHRRADLTWKGILQVPLAPTHDTHALDILTLATAKLPIPAGP